MTRKADIESKGRHEIREACARAVMADQGFNWFGDGRLIDETGNPRAMMWVRTADAVLAVALPLLRANGGRS